MKKNYAKTITAATIRDAALQPRHRNGLARAIRDYRRAFPDKASRGTLLACVEEMRAEYFNLDRVDRRAWASSVEWARPTRADAIEEIEVAAAARACGMTNDDFRRKAVADAVARVRSSVGGDIALTRHERLALDSITAGN